jgi:saccharopine dehydrogenase-like NADP-dependent oxidoreductase
MKPTGHHLIDQEIAKHLGEDETVLLADGLENAFIGIGRQFSRPVTIYSYKKTLKCLKAMGMTKEDAIEYFDYNIAQSFVGDQTPIFLQDE